MIEEFIWYTVLLTIVATLGISIYGIVKRPNLVKKLIALTKMLLVAFSSTLLTFKFLFATLQLTFLVPLAHLCNKV